MSPGVGLVFAALVVGLMLIALCLPERRPADWLLARLQRRCDHDPRLVRADILEGDFHGGPGGEQAVEWCPYCGAYRRVFDVYGIRPRYSEWQRPFPALARQIAGVPIPEEESRA